LKGASVEIFGFHRLVRNIRDIEKALGDGIRRVYESELEVRKKLRRTPSLEEERREKEFSFQ
jgi:N-acetylneuraminate synthase